MFVWTSVLDRKSTKPICYFFFLHVYMYSIHAYVDASVRAKSCAAACGGHRLALGILSALSPQYIMRPILSLAPQTHWLS